MLMRCISNQSIWICSFALPGSGKSSRRVTKSLLKCLMLYRSDVMVQVQFENKGEIKNKKKKKKKKRNKFVPTMMGSLSSALVVRKALRKFLMKTHPDFFDADMLRKSSNEQGLKLINSLVDAATTDTSQSAPALQLPPVVRIKMHYRNQPDREPFEFQLAVPPSLSGRTSQDFSSEALVKMLIAAGEAPPDLASDWNKGAKREEWVTLAALDADGLKKEMQLESFMLDPPRRARDGMGATTKVRKQKKEKVKFSKTFRQLGQPRRWKLGWCFGRAARQFILVSNCLKATKR
jgi:hypothetical protein